MAKKLIAIRLDKKELEILNTLADMYADGSQAIIIRFLLHMAGRSFNLITDEEYIKMIEIPYAQAPKNQEA